MGEAGIWHLYFILTCVSFVILLQISFDGIITGERLLVISAYKNEFKIMIYSNYILFVN